VCQAQLARLITHFLERTGSLEPHPPPHAPTVALELQISDTVLPRDVSGRIDLCSLGLEPGREHPLFISARQRDQSRVWTSALFVTL